MYTRDILRRNYSCLSPTLVITPGIVRVTTRSGIQQTWPITRPGSAPSPNGAPFYVGADRLNHIIRCPTPTLQCGQPRVEADLSNRATWQRSYRFTG